MKRFFAVTTILIIAVLAVALPTLAAPNLQINYQGKLQDASGNLVTDGTYSIRFALYTAASGGTAVWQETQSVTVTSGLFSVLLGSVDATIADVNWNQTLYLGVKVGSDAEMTPRKKLGTVPSAFEADQLDGLDSTDFILASTTSLPLITTLSGLSTVGTIGATTTFVGNVGVNGTFAALGEVTGGYFTATSTTATSTISGKLVVGSTPPPVALDAGDIFAGRLRLATSTGVSSIDDELVLEDSVVGPKTLSQIIGSQCDTANTILSGGVVTWSGTGFTFDVSPITFCIGGLLYATTTSQQVTLDASDPTGDRIDLIVVDTSTQVSVITGATSTDPVAPSSNPATQLDLTFAYVKAGATEPGIDGTGPMTEVVYRENIAAEWVGTQNTPVGQVDFANTTNPYAGTKNIEVTTALGNGDYFQLATSSAYWNPLGFTTLSFYIKNKTAWTGTNPRLRLTGRNTTGSQLGSAVDLRDGVYGFDADNTTSYQKISIPLSAFGTITSSQVKYIRFATVTSGGATLNFRIDNIVVEGPVSGGAGTPSSGLSGAGQGNSLAFWTGTSTLAANSQLVWINSTGRFGIGTSSPFATLSVAGQTAADYFTAVSTTSTSTFPYLKTTNFFANDGNTILGNSDTAGEDSTRGYGNLLFTGTYDGSATLPATGAGTRLMWIPELAAIRAGRILPIGGPRVSDDEWNTIGIYSVAFGVNNEASAIASAALSGSANAVTGSYSVIGGGLGNSVPGSYGFIGGGLSNGSSGDYITISGGHANSVLGTGSVIGGGLDNVITGNVTTIVGGSANIASASSTFIGGGILNIASGSDGTGSQGSVVVGGYANASRQRGSFVGAGSNNDANGQFAVIPGGHTNYIGGQYSSILGGYKLTLNGDYSLLFGQHASTTADNSFIYAHMGNIENGFAGETLSIPDNSVYFYNASGTHFSIGKLNGTSLLGLDVGNNFNVDGTSTLATTTIAGTFGFTGGKTATTTDTNGVIGGLFSAIAGNGSGVNSTCSGSCPTLTAGTGGSITIQAGNGGYGNQNVIGGDGGDIIITSGIAGLGFENEVDGSPGTDGVISLNGLEINSAGAATNFISYGTTTLGHYQDGQAVTLGYGNLIFAGSSAASVPVTGGGTRLMWIPGLNAFRAGNAGTTQWNTIGAGSVAFGGFNKASGSYSFAAGYSNTASGDYASVLGGQSNTASNTNAVIAGGISNVASGVTAAVSGGSTNTAEGTASFIGGGYSNLASGGGAVIAGGNGNTASGPTSFIGGGYNNLASGSDGESQGSVVVAGSSNKSQQRGSFVGAGSYNNANGQFAVIPGGHTNYIGGQYSSILGGYKLTLNGEYSLLFGQHASTTADNSFIYAHMGNIENGFAGETLSIPDNSVYFYNASGTHFSIGKLNGTSLLGLDVGNNFNVDGTSTLATTTVTGSLTVNSNLQAGVVTAAEYTSGDALNLYAGNTFIGYGGPSQANYNHEFYGSFYLDSSTFMAPSLQQNTGSSEVVLCWDTNTGQITHSANDENCTGAASPFLISTDGTKVFAEVLANQWKIDTRSVNRLDGYDGTEDPAFVLGSFKHKETDYLDSIALELRCENNNVVTTKTYPLTFIGKLDQEARDDWLVAASTTDSVYYVAHEGDRTVLAFERPESSDYQNCDRATFAFVANGYYEWEELEFDPERTVSFWKTYSHYLWTPFSLVADAFRVVAHAVKSLISDESTLESSSSGNQESSPTATSTEASVATSTASTTPEGGGTATSTPVEESTGDGDTGSTGGDPTPPEDVSPDDPPPEPSPADLPPVDDASNPDQPAPPSNDPPADTPPPESPQSPES